MILNHGYKKLSFNVHEKRYALNRHIFKPGFAIQSTKMSFKIPIRLQETNLFRFLFTLDVSTVTCKLCSHTDNNKKEEKVLNNFYM